jgi:hypothetical protein
MKMRKPAIFIDFQLHDVLGRHTAGGCPRPVSGEAAGKSGTGRPEREFACVGEGRAEATRRSQEFSEFWRIRVADKLQKPGRGLLPVYEVQEHLRAGSGRLGEEEQVRLLTVPGGLEVDVEAEADPEAAIRRSSAQRAGLAATRRPATARHPVA